jgi:hypothetical protein
MQSIRHSFALAPAVMMAALAATPAQAQAQTATVTVPFSFNAAGKTFPAGEYKIARNDADDLVTLYVMGSSQSFSSLIGPGSPDPWEHKIALRFDEVGQAHLLQSIEFGPMITSKLDKKTLATERARGASIAQVEIQASSPRRGQ